MTSRLVIPHEQGWCCLRSVSRSLPAILHYDPLPHAKGFPHCSPLVMPANAEVGGGPNAAGPKTKSFLARRWAQMGWLRETGPFFPPMPSLIFFFFSGHFFVITFLVACLLKSFPFISCFFFSLRLSFSILDRFWPVFYSGSFITFGITFSRAVLSTIAPAPS